MKKDGSLLAEILLSIVVVLIIAISLVPIFAEEWRLRGYNNPPCVDNLKQLGLAMYMYANENKDRFPPLDDTRNNFMFDGNLLYPEYLTDAALLACPDDPAYDPQETFRLVADKFDDSAWAGEVHPDCLTDLSFVYLGWMVMSDEEAAAFFEAYDTLSPDALDENITVAEGKGNAGGSTLYRLSAGVDRFLITDINTIFCGPGGSSIVPIMWERPYIDPKKSIHQPSGGNVIYLDGHVEYLEMGDMFPMTEKMARLLEARPRDPIPDCEMCVALLDTESEN
jgi:prepilin-type processing-associated H-X9-DG protein